MAIEIVSLPIKNGGSFHSYVTVYQRVSDDDVVMSWLQDLEKLSAFFEEKIDPMDELPYRTGTYRDQRDQGNIDWTTCLVWP